MDSILSSIKKLLGVPDNSFDEEIIMDINTAFMGLGQLGIGSSDYFSISSASETWDDFSSGLTNFAGIKSYIQLQTKMLFDPPTSSFVIEALKNQIEELGWRLRAEIEHSEYIPESEGDTDDD